MPVVAQLVFKVNNCNVARSELKSKVREALMDCGQVAQEYASAGAPVKTGKLRDSFDHRMISDNTVAIGTDVEYGKYQELGTSRGIKPKLFLTNAVRGHIGEYEGIIEQTLK